MVGRAESPTRGRVRWHDVPVLKRYARWYGGLSPIVLAAVWLPVCAVVGLACGVLVVIGREQVGMVVFATFAGACLILTFGTFALIKAYAVPYYKGSLMDYITERRRARES